MTKFTSIVAATVVLSAGIALYGPQSANARMPNGLQPALDQLDAESIVNVQYSWRGQRYCWYVNGWRGPGWYRCGFHLRRGFGWGGPMGWHGWESGRGDFRRDRGFRRSEGGEFRRGEPRDIRRGDGIPRREMRDGRGPGGIPARGRGRAR